MITTRPTTSPTCWPVSRGVGGLAEQAEYVYSGLPAGILAPATATTRKDSP